MHVAIRTDAAVNIGSGHVFRSLVLAAAFRDQGVVTSFLCRTQEGDLCSFIETLGYSVHRLPCTETAANSETAWEQDAAQCRLAIEASGTRPDWIVVDHYGLDYRWERSLRTLAEHVFVIDDLANRRHDCDVLLDQNFNSPLHSRYAQLLPTGAKCLLGTSYALLGAAFRDRKGDDFGDGIGVKRLDPVGQIFEY